MQYTKQSLANYYQIMELANKIIAKIKSHSSLVMVTLGSNRYHYFESHQ